MRARTAGLAAFERLRAGTVSSVCRQRRPSLRMALVDLVCEQPIVSSRAVDDRLGVTRPTALKLLRQLERVEVLTEVDHGPRGQRRYVARELVAPVTEERS